MDIGQEGESSKLAAPLRGKTTLQASGRGNASALSGETGRRAPSPQGKQMCNHGIEALAEASTQGPMGGRPTHGLQSLNGLVGGMAPKLAASGTVLMPLPLSGPFLAETVWGVRVREGLSHAPQDQGAFQASCNRHRLQRIPDLQGPSQAPGLSWRWGSWGCWRQ